MKQLEAELATEAAAHTATKSALLEQISRLKDHLARKEVLLDNARAAVAAEESSHAMTQVGLESERAAHLATKQALASAEAKGSAASVERGVAVELDKVRRRAELNATAASAEFDRQIAGAAAELEAERTRSIEVQTNLESRITALKADLATLKAAAAVKDDELARAKEASKLAMAATATERQRAEVAESQLKVKTEAHQTEKRLHSECNHRLSEAERTAKASATAAAAAQARLQAEIDQLQCRILELEASVQSSELAAAKAAEAKEESLVKLERELADTNERARASIAELVALQARFDREVAAADAARAELTAAKEGMVDQAAKLEAKLTIEIEAHRRTKLALADTAQAAKADSEKLQGRADAEARREATLAAKLDEAHNSIAAAVARAKAAEMAAKATETKLAQQKEAAANELRTAVAALQRRLDATEAEATGLRDKLDAVAEDHAATVEALEDEVAKLDDELQEALAEADQWKYRLDGFQKAKFKGMTVSEQSMIFDEQIRLKMLLDEMQEALIEAKADAAKSKWQEEHARLYTKNRNRIIFKILQRPLSVEDRERVAMILRETEEGDRVEGTGSEGEDNGDGTLITGDGFEELIPISETPNDAGAVDDGGTTKPSVGNFVHPPVPTVLAAPAAPPGNVNLLKRSEVASITQADRIRMLEAVKSGASTVDDVVGEIKSGSPSP